MPKLDVIRGLKVSDNGSPSESACSAFTVREALLRCARLDEYAAKSERTQAAQFRADPSPHIKRRALGSDSLAENYDLSAARYRSALAWLEGSTDS